MTLTDKIKGAFRDTRQEYKTEISKLRERMSLASYYDKKDLKGIEIFFSLLVPIKFVKRGKNPRG